MGKASNENRKMMANADYLNILLTGYTGYSDTLAEYYWNAYKESGQERTFFFTGLRKALEAINNNLTAAWANASAHWISEKPKREHTRIPFPLYGIHIGENEISIMAQACLVVMNRAKEEVTALPPEGTQSPKKEKDSDQRRFDKLEEVFTKKFREAIQVLQTVENPVIDKDYNYLLGPREKGAITAWIEVLRGKGYLRDFEATEMAELLNATFHGLNASEKVAQIPRNKAKRVTAHNQYYTKFSKSL